MQHLAVAESEEQQFILSNLPPSPAQKRLALGIVIGLATALYLVVGPFGGQQLGASYSFVAIYTTAMFVTDLITAILLFAQFSILRSRAILVIASGYLFTALLIVPYVIAFPGVLAPGGLAGGLQTTAHLYLMWHCGFPLFIIGYALLKDDESFGLTPQGKIGKEILFSVSMTAAAACAVTIWCMNGGALLPDIMLDQSQIRAELALCGRGADCFLVHCRAGRLVAPPALDPRSIPVGRAVCLPDRDTAPLFSVSRPLQHRLVRRARNQPAVE